MDTDDTAATTAVEPTPGWYATMSVPAQSDDDIDRLADILETAGVPALIATDAMSYRVPRIWTRLLLAHGAGVVRLAPTENAILRWELLDVPQLTTVLVREFGGGVVVGDRLLDGAGTEVIQDEIAGHDDAAIRALSDRDNENYALTTFAWAVNANRMDAGMIAQAAKQSLQGVLGERPTPTVFWPSGAVSGVDTATVGLARGSTAMFRAGPRRGFAHTRGGTRVHWWDELWERVDPDDGRRRSLDGYAVTDWLDAITDAGSDPAPLIEALKIDHDRASELRALLREPYSDQHTFERVATLLRLPHAIAVVAEHGPGAAPENAETFEPTTLKSAFLQSYEEELQNEAATAKPSWWRNTAWLRYSARHPRVRWGVSAGVAVLIACFMTSAIIRESWLSVAVASLWAVIWLADLVIPRAPFLTLSTPDEAADAPPN